MDEQTRYRVTGSLFLLAVAIICLPMLFDGEGEPPVAIEALEVAPEVPAFAPLDAVAPASNFIARVEEFREQYDDQGFASDSGTRVGEPVLAQPTDTSRAWAVQVASFIEADNAVKLRDQLREQGYEAFISTVRSDADVLSRVAVGPLLSEQDARELRDDLARMLALDAQVVAFSN